jgi:hypothetical protein
MKLWERILLTLSAVYAISGLFGELFWPAHLRFLLDDFFFPFGLLFLGYIFVKKKEWRWFIAAFVLLSAWGLFSDLLANHSVRSSALGMLIRWLKWPIICLSVAQIGGLNITKRSVENGMSLVFLSLVAINLVILLNPFGVGQSLSAFYAPKHEVLLANYHEFGAFRLSGTFLNPNNNAGVFALFLLFFLHVDARKYWKYILLAFVLIFLTQSRTTLVISVVILGIYVVRINSIRLTFVMIPAAILTLFGGMLLFRSTGLLSIINGTAFQSNSWMQRMEHYSVFSETTSRELVVGHGIILDPITEVGFYFDSEYLSILYQYGIVGGIIWLLSIFFLARVTSENILRSGFSISIILLILGVSITNFAFFNVEFATLLSVLCGAWIFFQTSDKLHNNSEEKSK